jgi:PAS domain S-box-containing protein
MNEFLLRGLRDPRLAAHAIASQGAWLWAPDGARVLWANATGATLLGARSIPDLAARRLAPHEPLRVQLVQLAARLPQNGAPRLERLRGLGAPLGQLSTCSCARLTFPGGVIGILVVAAAAPRKPLTFPERCAALLDGVDEAVALFAGNGKLVAANASARTALAEAEDLGAAGLDSVRDALDRDGRTEAVTERARFALFRLGAGAEVATAAIMTPFPLPSQNARIRDAAVEPDHSSVDGEPALSEAQTPTQETLIETPVMPVTPPPPATEPHDPLSRPQRFVWRIDADGAFTVEDARFAALIGTAALQRPWREIAADIDRDGRVGAAMATADTFSNLPTVWRTSDGVEIDAALFGLPMFDAERKVTGYRGFGLYRHAPAQPAASTIGTPTPSDIVATPPESPSTAPGNVLRFPSPEPRSPMLSPTENRAFDELARQLSARLEAPPASDPQAEQQNDEPAIAEAPPEPAKPEPAVPDAPKPEMRPFSTAASRGEIDRPLLDRLPTGLLVYRLDRLLYANPAFLTQTGHASLHALTEAGGLDALYIEPGVAAADSHSDGGTPLTLSRTKDGDKPLDARLFAISWDGESAMALVLDQHRDLPPPVPAFDPQADDIRRERDALRAILDVTTDGIVVVDGAMQIVACNRSAEALFGKSGTELGGSSLAELFAAESQGKVLDYADGIRRADGASLLGHGSDVLGRVRDGSFIPLSLTMGRTPGDGLIFAMFRDLSQARVVEVELAAARRQSERAASVKSDVLGKISHDIRAPLSSIIGFAELMIEERFGPLGNPRYITYLKDIRASGERVVKLIDDLADLSRIETGKIELAPTTVALNELVEQCVALMQPQANRERIIIRSSLAHNLPSVTADASALKKITLDLLSTAIRLNAPGGQVIVSTALTDIGDVALRIRDTGTGLSSADISAALEPYRADKAQEQTSGIGVGLSLTRALAEANRARFEIRSAPNSGTLIEVLFSRAT